MEGRRALASLLHVLPAALLATVAAVQIALARTESLSPWKGGGFGMFSTTDALAYRTLRAYARQGAAVFELPIPDELGDAAVRARLLPTDARLRALARGLAAIQAQASVGWSAVRVEAWRRTFDPDGLVPHPVLLRHVEVELRPDDG